MKTIQPVESLDDFVSNACTTRATCISVQPLSFTGLKCIAIYRKQGSQERCILHTFGNHALTTDLCGDHMLATLCVTDDITNHVPITYTVFLLDEVERTYKGSHKKGFPVVITEGDEDKAYALYPVKREIEFTVYPSRRLLALPGMAKPAEIRVMISGAFTAAYNELVPIFEQRTGYKVITAYGASMGVAPDAIPVRLQRGEPADVVIMAEAGLAKLIGEGRIAAGSRIDIVRSAIGVAVRAGAPRPDISTVAALRKTMLEARSIAYSASASGTYLSTELFQRLDIVNEMNITARKILSERVGSVVARGDVELGFQQVSELLPIAGIDYVGPLPSEVQCISIFTSGLLANAREPDAARALIAYMTSPEVAAVVRRTGLDPIPLVESKP